MYHIIMNPSAASGKGADTWKYIQKRLEQEQIAYEAHCFDSAKETKRFVENLTAVNNWDGEDHNIIVLGGDGTLNTVLNGIQDFEHTVLSCIRTGSGNDFARNMGISKRVEEALEGILHHSEDMLLDYGVVEYQGEQRKGTRRFLISSGIGYDADICEEVSRSRLKRRLNRIHLGKLVYVAIGIKQIFTRHSVAATIIMDNGECMQVPELFFGVGMIHPMEGGGVPFCPRANPQDGMLDVCLVNAMSKVKLLLAVMLVYAKQHYLFRAITEHRCRSLTIKTSEPQWFHMDGETPCKVEYVRMCCENGLRFRM
ncbi:MAG: YegS/Rv2252/BmrU family lipid kinase [Lachnospiraceae bacterium]|nr:YegS/Rv2252/BmrU family lipid kinase [Lachnospiraceae bacterium]HCJ07795.1 diacylglycerol kinase [Lachnospiraceae bacterium]